MDPLTPNDPLWKLLGKARPVQVRGNFTANVLREARNTPQEQGWGYRLASLLKGESLPWLRPALAVALVALLGVVWLPPSADTTTTATVTVVEAVAPLADADMALIANDVDLALEGMNHLDTLVAMEDTSALTDTEIAFLLY